MGCGCKTNIKLKQPTQKGKKISVDIQKRTPTDNKKLK